MQPLQETAARTLTYPSKFGAGGYISCNSDIHPLAVSRQTLSSVDEGAASLLNDSRLERRVANRFEGFLGAALFAILQRGDDMSITVGATPITLPSISARRPGVLQRRFYDFNVWSDKKLRERLDYMHRNPCSANSSSIRKTGPGAVGRTTQRRAGSNPHRRARERRNKLTETETSTPAPLKMKL